MKDDGADEAPPHAFGRSAGVRAIKTANPESPEQDEQGGERHFSPGQTEDDYRLGKSATKSGNDVRAKQRERDDNGRRLARSIAARAADLGAELPVEAIPFPGLDGRRFRSQSLDS